MGYCGETQLNAHSSIPFDYLSLFLTEEFWSLITTETNRYANQYLLTKSDELKDKLGSRFHHWINDNTCVHKSIRTKNTADGHRDILRPKAVDTYIYYIGGVDTSDQRMKTYLFPHRSNKWYFRIFNAIMSICMVNAHNVPHIIYCRTITAPEIENPIKQRLLCRMSSSLF